MGLQLARTRTSTVITRRRAPRETETELQQALSELRELARGIHPAVLTDHGLDAAIRTLAERAPVPVSIEGNAGQLPDHIETAAYFVISEALTNVAKHANASRAVIRVHQDTTGLEIEIDDDGVGAASPLARQWPARPGRSRRCPRRQLRGHKRPVAVALKSELRYRVSCSRLVPPMGRPPQPHPRRFMTTSVSRRNHGPDGVDRR